MLRYDTLATGYDPPGQNVSEVTTCHSRPSTN